MTIPIKMNIWSQIPFLRLLLPFIAGILTAVYSEWQFAFLNYIIPSFFFVIALFVFIKALNVSYAYSWIFGTFITITLFLSGFQLTVLNTDKFKSNHFSRFMDDAELFYVKTNEPYLEKEKSYKISVSILAIRKNGKWVNTSGNAMCYFKKDSTFKNVRYGDGMVVKTKFTEVKPPQNPSEFDYKRYLSFHAIYHQAFVPSENYVLLGQNQGNRIISSAFSIREYLLDIYRENNITGKEFAVGSALVLGYEDKLDQEIISAYASSGALHVLSVSGLHVGIIYLIFNYLFLFLDKIKNGKAIKMILLLLILWFYATLTGLSPSVLRSATMFSFIIVAQTWRYNTNIFNTLSVSCFALLLYHPYLIMEVGFQLSFLAVLGIVSIQPWLYDKWQPNNWLMNQIWLITTVSIAAQMATFPLALLYFHQFPNYFLFSNLLVIPISSIILIYGLVVFAVGKMAVVGSFAAKLFSYIVFFLNETVEVFDKMPGALIEAISISVFDTWLIYFIMVLLMLFIVKKKTKHLFISLASVVVLLTIQAFESYMERKQNKFIVYNIQKTSAYDFISGKKTVFLADLALLNSPSKIIFHIKRNWWDSGVENLTYLEREKHQKFSDHRLYLKNNFIQFLERRIVLVDKDFSDSYSTNEKINVDYILFSKNTKIKINALKRKFKFKKLIIDSSNSNYNNEKWTQECIELGIDYYSVINSGAYIEYFK